MNPIPEEGRGLWAERIREAETRSSSGFKPEGQIIRYPVRWSSGLWPEGLAAGRQIRHRARRRGGRAPLSVQGGVRRQWPKVGSTPGLTRASFTATGPTKRGHRSPDPPCKQGELTSTVAPAEHYASSRALVGPLPGCPGTRRGLASQAHFRSLPRRPVPAEAVTLSADTGVPGGEKKTAGRQVPGMIWHKGLPPGLLLPALCPQDRTIPRFWCPGPIGTAGRADGPGRPG